MNISDLVIPDSVFKRMSDEDLIKLKSACETELSERKGDEIV